GALRLLEVPLREVVGLPVRPVEPVEEPEVVAEPVGNTAVEERTSEPDRVLLLARVPGVRLSVAVVVPEVVGLPGQGREHHRHAVFSEVAGRYDERRKAETTVRRSQTREIEPALPATDRQGKRASARRAADRPLPRYGDAVHHRVGERRGVLGPGLEDLHRESGRVVVEHEPGAVARAVALALEGGLDGRQELRVSRSEALEAIGAERRR